MRMFAGLAVQGIMLALASPAAAQGQPQGGGEYRSYGPVLPPRGRAAAPRIFLALPPPEPGPAAGAGPLVRSVPVADNAALSLGLISVAATVPREMARRRTEPLREGRTGRMGIAALGFSLRF
ncbi:MAG: hypothetical protein JOZ90_03785 [Alphaproteobacteria bacterium]|nr:hypothetical protein [Alphaproteobacteria bacterium]MBV9371878.1 hypothetical protein [Alphaproteobacteria bacterium]MBV9900201.1 hypothetical protein [Alphaproteobacteria bacterium]